jgi:phospholipase C
MDNLFGATTSPAVDGFPSGFDQPGFSWPAPFGQSSRSPTPAPLDCNASDPNHQLQLYSAWHGGAMDLFVQSCGPQTMQYYADATHPFYSWLAQNFAVADRYFAPILSGTWPNRLFLYCGSNAGSLQTLTPPNHPSCGTTIFDLASTTTQFMTPPAIAEWTTVHITNLAAPDANWWDFQEGALGWNTQNPYYVSYPNFIAQLSGDTLPRVVFVDTGDGYDEHPNHGITRGESLVQVVLSAIRDSPVWSSTVVFITYDEGGGYFDHVAPPPACPADPTASDPSGFAGFNSRYGFRVPLIVVSPFVTSAGYVSPVVHSHTSIDRFIEAWLNVGAMTSRDANSDALLDMFDFHSTHVAISPPSSSFPDPTDTTMYSMQSHCP